MNNTVRKDINSIINTFFFCLRQLVKDFLYRKHHEKKWSSTEKASNETVVKKSWRYLFANPDIYICKFKWQKGMQMEVWEWMCIWIVIGNVCFTKADAWVSQILNNDIRPVKLFCVLKKSSLRKQLIFLGVSTKFLRELTFKKRA